MSREATILKLETAVGTAISAALWDGLTKDEAKTIIKSVVLKKL